MSVTDPGARPPRIVFVDDEARVLSGLRRQLHARRGEWELFFVEGGPQCLAALEQSPADVVVSDMRMPGMDGAQLLARVAAGWPRTARLVLSGHADPDRVQVARSCAHRYLHKPCPPELLEAEVRRVLRLRAALDRSGWTVLDRVWGAPPLFTAEGDAAPPDAPAAFRAAPAHGSAPAENASDALVARLDRDPAAVSRLCTLVPAGAGACADATPAALIERVGARNLPALIMALRFHDRFFAAGDSATASASAANFERAVATAQRARRAADGEGQPVETGAQAAAAALLAAVWDSLPADSDLAPELRRELLELLLSAWGLPDGVVAAVAFRQQPELCPAAVSAPLAALCAAELLSGWEGAPHAPDAARQTVLVDWLKSRGWSAHPQAWPGKAPSDAAPAR